MSKKIKKSFIYEEIFPCRTAFKNVEEGISERERRNVKRGKLLLKLLSTIGSEDFFSWLRTAEPAGYFYDFKGYKIVKKNTNKKDVIDIKELPKIAETVRQCFAKDINNPGMDGILDRIDLASSGYDSKDAKMLIPAIALLVGKMANVIYKPQYQVGDIYHNGDMTEVVNNVSLIDLYMSQQKIENEEEAIDELCTLKWVNISDDISQEIKFDKRTRWLNRSIIYGSNSVNENPAYEYIRFRDRDSEQLLGNVLIDKDGIVEPQTFWSKNLNYPGRPLAIPFPGPLPLWNLDTIRGYDEQVKVILTDSLLVAFSAYKETQLKIERLNYELEILKQKKAVSYYGWQDSEFEKELTANVVTKLGIKHPYFEKENQDFKYEQEYAKARMIFRLDGYNFKFVKKLALDAGAAANSVHVENVDKQLYARLPFPNLQQSKYDLLNWLNNFTTPNGFASNDYPNVKFEVFRTAYTLISEYIAQKQKEDNARVDKIEQQFSTLKETVWSSWYGGKDTVDKVDWSGLKKRHVFYIIRKHDKENYETAIRCYWGLKNFDSVTLKFVDYEKLLKNPEYEGISSEEFIGSIPKEFNINIDALKKTKISQVDPMSTPDIYDPDKPDEGIVEYKFLLKPLMLEKSITLIYSEPGSAKTWIALSLANAMLNGCPAFMPGLGWQADSPKRVLFIDSEMSNNSFKNRLSILKPFYKKMSEQCEHGKSPYNLQYKQVAHDGWDLTDDGGEYRDKVNKWLNLNNKDRIDCLILDNLSSLSDFNDSGKSWSNLFKWLKNICERGCTCIVLHHANKTTGDQRGSSIKSATVDNIIRVKKALPGINNNIAVTIAIEKARDAFGKALDPFNVMLKFNKDDAAWTTTKANGTKNISTAERNKMILDTVNSGAFNQKIVADYFGIDVATLKPIVAQARAKEKSDNEKKLDKILSGLELEDQLKHKLFANLSKIFIKKYGKAKEEKSDEELE